MITLNQACKIAYEQRNSFNAVFELGIDRIFDRESYWEIAFDYIDQDSYGSPLALCPTGKGLYFCIEKNSGRNIEGEDYAFNDTPPGHEVPVPDEYYRVPWYEESN